MTERDDERQRVQRNAKKERWRDSVCECERERETERERGRDRDREKTISLLFQKINLTR